MIVDISHVSDETFWDVMGVTTKPVIASHSSCRALCDHPRNMDDDMIRAVGENGGVIGINFYPEFIDQTYKDRREAARGGSVVSEFRVPEEREPSKLDEMARKRHVAFAPKESEFPTPTIETVVDHIDHVVKLAGVDHVGLGSDFDGIDVAPEGLEDVTKYPDLTDALLARGYSETDVEKILGENFLRVLREVTGS
jgi:membrane dipeptidase